MFIIDLILKPYRLCVITQNATIGYVVIARIRTSMPDMASAPAMTLWKNMGKAELPVFEAGFITVFQLTNWFDWDWRCRKMTGLRRQKTHLTPQFLHWWTSIVHEKSVQQQNLILRTMIHPEQSLTLLDRQELQHLALSR